MIQQLNPLETWHFWQQHSEAVLIDVRSQAEFAFVGHAVGALLIPWKELPDWQVNPDFVATVQRYVPDCTTPIMLMCRSGQRSLEAAQALQQAGYTQLINITEGFEGPLDPQKHRGTLGGWRYHGLPWEQS